MGGAWLRRSLAVVLAVVAGLLFPALSLAQAPTFSESFGAASGNLDMLETVARAAAAALGPLAPGLRVSVGVRYTPKGGTSRILRFTFRIP